ncbi:MAG: Acid sugar phosphatase [candidate division WS2 bacterium]|nr:Acid sugar phosphatase [Candidatus Lithacetigena glycinireducens]
MDAVVVGLDRRFNYNKLKIAQSYILEGAVLIGANPDTSFPAEDGRIEPGGGSILKAVEAASGIKAVIIGKPEGPLVDMALNHLGTPPLETAFIGDRLDTDVLSAKRYSLYSVLVLTGVSGQRKDTTIKDIKPDLVVTDLYELINLLEKNSQKLKYYRGSK